MFGLCLQVSLCKEQLSKTDCKVLISDLSVQLLFLFISIFKFFSILVCMFWFVFPFAFGCNNVVVRRKWNWDMFRTGCWWLLQHWIFFHTIFLGFAKQVQFVAIAKFFFFSISFHRLLQKARLKRNNAVVIRDSLRNEMSKRSKTEEENREKREQLVSENKNFGCQDYNSFL